MRIGVLGNPKYGQMSEVIDRLARSADALDLDLRFHEDLLPFAGDDAAELADAWEELDCLLTLGGDGTLLRAARLAGPRGVPVLGCNLGRLGFMTAAPLSELEKALERVVAGDFEEEPRLALDVVVHKADGAEQEDGGERRFYALNDAVVHKSGFARLVRLRVWADEEEVGQYSADGIIISTATGSTAYSLSAGGPILVPSLDALVATPICPHTLAVRPVVLPADARITVQLPDDYEDVILTIDGQVGGQLRGGDRVEAARAVAPVRLIRFPGETFFSVMRQKLRWGDVRPAD